MTQKQITSGKPTLKSTSDLTALVAAFKGIIVAIGRVGEAIGRVGEAIGRWLRGIRPFVDDLERQMRIHGAGNLAGDDSWQSDMCAAWVHASCPLTGRCDCTCHGGTVR